MTQSGMLWKDELIYGPQPCGGARLYGIGPPRPGALRKISIVSQVLEHGPPPTIHRWHISRDHQSCRDLTEIGDGVHDFWQKLPPCRADIRTPWSWDSHSHVASSLSVCMLFLLCHRQPLYIQPLSHITSYAGEVDFASTVEVACSDDEEIEGTYLLAKNISDETGFLGLDCKFYAIESSIPYSASNHFSLFWPARFLLEALSATGKLFAPIVETSVRLFFSSSSP